MARIFTFRGKNPEEFKEMKLEQYLPLINSRQRRAVKRMGMQYKALVAEVDDARKSGGQRTQHILDMATTRIYTSS